MRILAKQFIKTENLLFSFTLIFIIIFWLFAVLHKINIHLDLDSYDEGVYWQTLMSLSNHFKLYSQIFYSQPPAFIWGIYPSYLIFGKTILAARLGIVFYSLIALVSTFVIGKIILNKWLGLVLAILLVFNLPFIKESKTLQAEMPMLALGMISYACALYYANSEVVKKSLYYLLASLVFLVLAILTKLLAVSLIIPITIIVINKVIKPYTVSLHSFHLELKNIGIAVLGGLVVLTLILIPYINHINDLYNQVIQFHLAAKTTLLAQDQINKTIILDFVKDNIYLFALAIIGVVVGAFRKNKYLLPTLVWFAILMTLLGVQKPLFYHHIVVIVPVLAILASLSFSRVKNNLDKTINLIALTLVGLIVLSNAKQILTYENNLNLKNQKMISSNNQIAQDLNKLTSANDFVVTDNQFVVGLAQRQTLPNLVDTSSVRVQSGYLTNAQLRANLLNPKVTAVLLYNNKFNEINDSRTQTILLSNFNLGKSYPGNIQAWYKKN